MDTTGHHRVIILTFTLMIATKILAGKEIIIYYHHEIAVVATTVLFLRILHQHVIVRVGGQLDQRGRRGIRYRSRPLSFTHTSFQAS